MPRYVRSVLPEREREDRSSGYRRAWDEPEDYAYFLSEARNAVFQQTKEVIRQGREFDRMQHQRAIRERKFLNSAGTTVPFGSPTDPLSSLPSELGSPLPLSPLSLTVPQTPPAESSDALSPLDPSSIVYPWEVTSPGPGAEPPAQPIWEQPDASAEQPHEEHAVQEPVPATEASQQAESSEVYRMLAELREDEQPVEGEVKSFVRPLIEQDRGHHDERSSAPAGRTRFVWRPKGGWQGTLAKTPGGYHATMNKVQSTLQLLHDGPRPMSAAYSPARLQPTFSVPATWSIPPSPTSSCPGTPAAPPAEIILEEKPKEKPKELDTKAEEEPPAKEVDQSPTTAVQPLSPKAQPLVPSMAHKKKKAAVGPQPWVGVCGKVTAR